MLPELNRKTAWKKELYTFLLNYRATPHSTTGYRPSELLFNRSIQTKLPQTVTVRDRQKDSVVQSKDEEAKSKSTHGQSRVLKMYRLMLNYDWSLYGDNNLDCTSSVLHFSVFIHKVFHGTYYWGEPHTNQYYEKIAVRIGASSTCTVHQCAICLYVCMVRRTTITIHNTLCAFQNIPQVINY